VPTKFDPKKLIKLRDLDEQLSVFLDGNAIYLAYQTDTKGHVTTYLYTRVSQKQYNLLKQGQFDLFDIFRETPNAVHLVAFHAEKATPLLFSTNPKSIGVELLPPPGTYLR
jgi:hypothetical protein